MSELFALFAAVSLTPVSLVIAAAITVVFSILGGAASGMRIAGADLGNEMAALMGGLYGVMHALPAVTIGLIVLLFI